MAKLNTAKNPDPQSKRSKKRKSRAFTKSRPERRAERRHLIALGAYNATDPSSRKPGAVNHW